MSTTEHNHANTTLPPISMFTSPPLNSKSSLPILPKPTTGGDIVPDQNILWALFSQFQQHQQETTNNNKERRASDKSTNSNSSTLTSEEVLAEKRRRNAGASARFRDRRKQREKELYERCNQLEQRTKELENALRYFDQDHPLLSLSTTTTTTTTTTHTPDEQPHNNNFTEQNTLFDRVSQLENMMARFKQEKETDVQKLDELEKENKYLRSLLVPVHSSKRSRSSSFSDKD